jgi:hypothetical protein
MQKPDYVSSTCSSYCAEHSRLQSSIWLGASCVVTCQPTHHQAGVAAQSSKRLHDAELCVIDSLSAGELLVTVRRTAWTRQCNCTTETS